MSGFLLHGTIMCVRCNFISSCLYGVTMISGIDYKEPMCCVVFLLTTALIYKTWNIMYHRKGKLDHQPIRTIEEMRDCMI